MYIKYFYAFQSKLQYLIWKYYDMFLKCKKWIKNKINSIVSENGYNNTFLWRKMFLTNFIKNFSNNYLEIGSTNTISAFKNAKFSDLFAQCLGKKHKIYRNCRPNENILNFFFTLSRPLMCYILNFNRLWLERPPPHWGHITCWPRSHKCTIGLKLTTQPNRLWNFTHMFECCFLKIALKCSLKKKFAYFLNSKRETKIFDILDYKKNIDKFHLFTNKNGLRKMFKM